VYRFFFELFSLSFSFSLSVFFLKVEDFSLLLIKFNLDLLFVLFVSVFFDFLGDFKFVIVVFLLFKYSLLIASF